MSSPQSAEEVASALLASNGLKLQQLRTIQSLWAGYGQICHITATEAGGPTSNTKHSYILKFITPPPTKANEEGHTRKILSYQVEQYFYSHLAPQLPPSIPVAKCLGSINRHHSDGTSTTAMMLSDLKQHFPVPGEKRHVLSSTQVDAAIDWLSGFHGFWWSRVNKIDHSLLVLPPLEEVQSDGQDASEKAVWLNGGYTYLATRRSEYANLKADQDSEWSSALTNRMDSEDESIAEKVAAFLAPAATGSSPIERYQTLIHGDVKSENLFTSQAGAEVAFYDFQYTGLGLGVCDLAKLFTCSVPINILVASGNIPNEIAMQSGEERLLKRYWSTLIEAGKEEYDWDTFVFHWETALVDWLRFQASWGFWGNTEWLEARGRYILQNEQWNKRLRESMSKE
ncbi:kinase-like domain-containing protein [Phaeosphaeria sp. MPI-PUGE-AT-0046c]|nr:kinase-like domain-containing protein [Phaeosphaeria sp. MPI-PUGE-AT-0046c]